MRKELRDARYAKGLKQHEIATMIGITERMYRHMEAGTRTGRYELWRELAALTGVDQDDLRKQDTDNIPSNDGVVKNEGQVVT